MTTRVLYVGDTQVETLIAAKGIDTFTHTYYKDSAKVLRDALGPRPGIELTHMPASNIRTDFPSDAEGFAKYDVIILSDVGYQNFKLPFGNRELLVPMGPNRVTPFRQWVLDGGGLIMAGGWLTFSGLNGKGMWGGSPIEDVLPVTMKQGIDDLIDHPDGATLDVIKPDHPIVAGLEFDPASIILGYNKVFPKDDSEVVMTSRNDPFLVTGTAGKGRSIAYTTDPVYHLCGNLQLWENYGLFWERMCKWAAGQL
jgi:uncharacterized membrane protein